MFGEAGCSARFSEAYYIAMSTFYTVSPKSHTPPFAVFNSILRCIYTLHNYYIHV